MQSMPMFLRAFLLCTYFSRVYAPCDLPGAVPFPPGSVSGALPPPLLLAAAGQFATGARLSATGYTYNSAINGSSMSLLCDCSCFVNYLMDQFLPAHFSVVPPDTSLSRPVPRARSWTNFFSRLRPGGGAGAGALALWEFVPTLGELRGGDVLAYELDENATDTGHVMICQDAVGWPTAAPTLMGASAVVRASNPYPGTYAAAFWVAVSDSSGVLHQNDTRGPNATFSNGVGRGFLRFFSNATGAPVAYQWRSGGYINQIGVGNVVGFGMGRLRLPSPTGSATGSPTPSASVSVTPTASGSGTASATPSFSAGASSSFTGTVSPTAAATPSGSGTAGGTSPTPTATPSGTPSTGSTPSGGGNAGGVSPTPAAPPSGSGSPPVNATVGTAQAETPAVVGTAVGTAAAAVALLGFLAVGGWIARTRRAHKGVVLQRPVARAAFAGTRWLNARERLASHRAYLEQHRRTTASPPLAPLACGV